MLTVYVRKKSVYVLYAELSVLRGSLNLGIGKHKGSVVGCWLAQRRERAFWLLIGSLQNEG